MRAKTAEENRVKFGQSKADREAEAARKAKATKKLDGAKREP